MEKLIEMVCTGNQGRSPVAELIANNYLRKIGADGYRSISSGTMVADIKEGNVPVAFKQHVVGVAAKRDDIEIYTPLELEQIDAAIKQGDKEAISYFFDKANYVFVQEERQNRKDILPLFGIEGVVKHEQEQTVARTDTVAVFSMAEKNNQQVKDIYIRGQNVMDLLNGKLVLPVVDVLSRYALQDKDAEIPNAFGLPQEAYKKAVAALVEQTPMALDRLLG